MSRDQAEKMAEAVWVKLLARLAMIVCGTIGSVGIPAAVIYLRETGNELRALDRSVAALRADWRNDQTADAGRFSVMNARVENHEDRLRMIETRLNAPVGGR